MIVPLVMTLWFSFQHYNLVDPRPPGSPASTTTEYLVTDPDFWVSLENTLILLGSVLVITVGLGTLLAVLFDQPFPRPQHRPRAGDLAVLRHAHRQRAGLEEPDDAPDLRRVRRRRAQRRVAAGGLVRATSRWPRSSPSSPGSGCRSRC